MRGLPVSLPEGLRAARAALGYRDIDKSGKKTSERQSGRRLILLGFLQYLHRNLHTFTLLENIRNDIEYLENQSNDLKFSGEQPPCGFESRPRHLSFAANGLCRTWAIGPCLTISHVPVARIERPRPKECTGRRPSVRPKRPRRRPQSELCFFQCAERVEVLVSFTGTIVD